VTVEPSLTVTVEWGDCDPAGIVFYPNYLRWIDAAFHHLLAATGTSHEQLAAAHGAIGTPLVEVRVRFLRPSGVGDTLRIESVVERWERKRFHVRHRIYNGETLAVEATETRCWAGRDADGRMRALPIPEELRHLLDAQ